MSRYSQTKQPLYVVVIELILTVVLFLPLAYEIKNNSGLLQGLLASSSSDDAITGWLVIPAMLGDLFMGIGYVIVLILGFIYFMGVGLCIGFHVIIDCINKEKKVFLFLLSITPAILLAIFIIGKLISLSMQEQSAFLLLYMIPAAVLLVDAVIDACRFFRRQ